MLIHVYSALFSPLWESREVLNVHVNRNKGRKQRKSQIISLLKLIVFCFVLFVLINKRWQLFVATIQNLCLPSLSPIRFLASNLLFLRKSPCHSSNCVTSAFPPKSLILSYQLILILGTQICSVFSILRCRGPND